MCNAPAILSKEQGLTANSSFLLSGPWSNIGIENKEL
jgi:hypothetical protein